MLADDEQALSPHLVLLRNPATSARLDDLARQNDREAYDFVGMDLKGHIARADQYWPQMKDTSWQLQYLKRVVFNLDPAVDRLSSLEEADEYRGSRNL